MYQLPFLYLAKKINPYVVIRYLEHTGWKQIHRKREDIKVFQKDIEGHELYQISIPLDKALSDYAYTMADSIDQILKAEGESPIKIFFDFLKS